MLINQITGNTNYVKSLKQRRWVFIGLLSVGAIGLICSVLLVPNSSLGNHARGFYSGAATGLTAFSLIFLIRTQYLISHPEAQKRAKISERDERSVQIAGQAAQIAGLVTFFAAAAALFIVLPFNMTAYFALMGVILLYFLVFLVIDIFLYYRR